MRRESQMVYVPDELVMNARNRGLKNLSKFVRDALTEYVKVSPEAVSEPAVFKPAVLQEEVHITTPAPDAPDGEE